MNHCRAECQVCEGTGLYRGMAERDGYAVVCSQCRGTGEVTISYIPFTYRKAPPPGVTKVIRVNPGIVVGEIAGKNFGGISVEEWVRGGGRFDQGTEMREYSCPAWWYQLIGFELQVRYEECAMPGQRFSQCKKFDKKHLCWDRFDKEAESVTPSTAGGGE